MALTQVDGGLLSPINAQYTGFKNRIINPAMMIDQRNAGASVTVTATGTKTYDVDRWFGFASQASKFSMQQNAGSVTPPVGFTKYLGATSLSAYSVGVSDYFFLNQVIEGFNIADLGWGTANAKAVTLSFQVYSSLTGTFGGALINGAATYSYPFTYTVSSANTWTTITITIAGPTSGTWASDNTAGIQVCFGLGVGSSLSATPNSWTSSSNIYGATGATSVVGTSGATFYITGVQLEKGSTATSFDYRPYGTELVLCQRYYATSTANCQGYAPGTGSANDMGTPLYFPTTMRANPTITVTSTVAFNSGVTVLCDSPNFNYARFYIRPNSTGNQYDIGRVITLSAEL
jgi:hypothetical protein